MKIKDLSMFLESYIHDEKTGELKLLSKIELEHDWITLSQYHKDRVKNSSAKEVVLKTDNGMISYTLATANNKRNVYRVTFSL